MCGISLIINKDNNKEVDADLIKSITSKVAHRGPDDEGFYFGKNFALGHRRLSIIDLTSGGHQPMVVNDFVITFNGEIYNYIELREELKTLGHLFASESDTEVITVAYQEWGSAAFSRFNGMWALALVDLKNDEVILCRDQFGIKPLYYTTIEGNFYAGSEIKQFTDVSGFSAELNESVAVNFVTNGWLNYSEETFFKNVSELKPGYLLKFNLVSHQFSFFNWYNLREKVVKSSHSYQESVQQVRSLMLESIKIRMRSDVSVGSCLSGGIDSSTIVVLAKSQALASPEFSTITCCFDNERHDERYYSDQVSKAAGFHSFKIFPDLAVLIRDNVLDKMVYHQDQPFSGATHYLEYCVYQCARQHNLTVMLGGQGSDEFLCGYDDFYYVKVKELLRSFQFRKAFDLLHIRAITKGIYFFDEIESFLKSEFLSRLVLFVKKVFGMNTFPWLSEKWKGSAKKYNKIFKSNSVFRLSLQQMEFTSLRYQLHSEDRNSMLFSIESRLPFLDHRLVEYCLGLPTNYKLKGGVTKAVLRDAILELPEEIRNRKHKMGFISPDAEWMLSNSSVIRAELKAAVLETGFFTIDLVKKFDRFVEGEIGYDPLFFRVMALNRFIKVFKMRIS